MDSISSAAGARVEEGAGAAYPLQVEIDVDSIRQHHVTVMQLINLPTLVPWLRKYRLLPKEDLDRVSDAKHHGTIERTGFLLHSLYKKDQTAIDTFMKCLREEKEHPGHKEIIDLLEKGLPDEPARSPLFDILESKMKEIVRLINITKFLNTLTTTGAIKVSAFLDLANPDRTVEENLHRLIRVLEEKEVAGFVDFLSCLQVEPTPSHEELFKLLFKEVQVFFKKHPRREEIGASDRIEILQLETRGRLVEQEVLKRFKEHSKKLEDELKASKLVPLLLKHHVLSTEEVEDLSNETPAKQNQMLLKFVSEKTPFWVVRFAECLREIPENAQLSLLLLPDVSKKKSKNTVQHKKDKLFVVLCLGNYIEVDKDYNVVASSSEKMEEKCEVLRGQFSQMDFDVINLTLEVSSSSGNGNGGSPEKSGEDGNGEHRLQVQKHEQRLQDKFRTEVSDKCTEEAVVVIYITGLQFPFEDVGAPSDWPTAQPRKKFSGAVLLSNASIVSRKEVDCLKARDIYSWLEQIPQAYVTLIFDCRQNFVASFGKQRDPEVVEIMEDPWSVLTSLNSSTVVYYLRPDITAMAKLQDRDDKVKDAVGMLTDGINSAFPQFCLRKGVGGGVELAGACHMMFYETLSFYWHRRGRQHKAFVPAVAGDVSREFLGKKAIPCKQVFRVNLVRSRDQEEMFDFNQLQVQTGTMAGLSNGDTLELYHVLCPWLRVKGTVSGAQALNCAVTVADEDTLKLLSRTIRDIYQDDSLRTKDGSTEFLFAFKVLPPNSRVSVGTEGLTDGESAMVKQFAGISPQLNYISRGTGYQLLVKKSGGTFCVDDGEGDVTVRVGVKKLNQVLTFLEKIAWYKYIIRLKTQRPPLHRYNCFLTAEKPLLHSAVPLCEEFKIKWSSYEGTLPSSKGHQVILQNTDAPQTFWTPVAKDPHPSLEVEFVDNYVITALELKGDIMENKFVCNFDIFYQRNIYNQVLEGPNGETLSKSVPFSHEELVQFVTITPMLGPMEEFTISFKMIKKVKSPGPAKVVYGTVENLTVTNWAFHQRKGAGWKFSPPPGQDGRIDMQGYKWLTWSGKCGKAADGSDGAVMFDLGMPGVKLEKIEFTCISESKPLSKFALRLQTLWVKAEKLAEITSAWPRKLEFPQPLVVSNIQLWPAVQKQAAKQQHSNIKLQLQLYGNKHERPMEVEEGEILSFNFINFTRNPHFLYVLCLEETGHIKLLMTDLLQGVKEAKTAENVKKFIQTDIPEGHELSQIKDTYKVFVCQRKMYLDPFLQRSLSDYHHPSFYSVCTLGQKDKRSADGWCDYKFEVVVKRSTSRK